MQTPHGDGWRLRPYRKGDERLLARQFERVFKRPMTASYWHWKLKEWPCAVENVWLGVDNADRPIFQYAAMPRRLRLPGETVEALVLVDLWTDPAYRDRRIFTRSAAWIHDRWRSAGVACVFSPFNDREEPRYARLGWRFLVPLSWQIRPLRPEAVVARRLGLPKLARQRWLGNMWNNAWRSSRAPPQGLVLEPPRPASDGGDDKWEDCAAVSLERGPAWVRWRYGRCPRFTYRILQASRGGRQSGYLIYRVDETGGRRFGFVAELCTRDPRDPVRDALIQELVETLQAQDVVAIATLNVAGSDAHRSWRRRGFIFSWGSFYPHCLPLRRGLPLEAMEDPRSWAMAGGDYDVI